VLGRSLQYTHGIQMIVGHRSAGILTVSISEGGDGIRLTDGGASEKRCTPLRLNEGTPVTESFLRCRRFRSATWIASSDMLSQ
jgi:hypothetical protein